MSKKRGFLKRVLGIVICLSLLLGGLFVFNQVENKAVDQQARNESVGTFIQLDPCVGTHIFQIIP